MILLRAFLTTLRIRVIGITAGVFLISMPVFEQQGTVRQKAAELRNPVLPTGPDPWITLRDGYYYYMSTTGVNLTIWRTRNIADLGTADKRVVWTPPDSGPYSHDIWAPELHFLDGRWYIYFAADTGTNETHRLWVLEGCSSDPLGCTWTLKGKIADQTDKWAIDGTVFRDNGVLYLLWSGWNDDQDGTENIYIARLVNPWKVQSRRVLISTPQFPWEKVGDRYGQVPPHVDVNEAPEVLKHDGKIFVTYSASGCWTDYYSLGMLTARSGSDLLHQSAWMKSPKPVFWQSPEAKVYGPGHNAFFRGGDGTRDWIIYHANSSPNEGCGDTRSPRVQPFSFGPDGIPDFGRPVSVDIALPRP